MRIVRPGETVIDAPPTLTPYERTLTWLVLTLLGTLQTHPPVAALSPTRDDASPSTVVPYRGRLTKREREVIRLVAQGWTNAQIGAHLFVSRRTIDQHLASIYQRLGVSSRAAATRFAILNDLC